MVKLTSKNGTIQYLSFETIEEMMKQMDLFLIKWENVAKIEEE